MDEVTTEPEEAGLDGANTPERAHGGTDDTVIPPRSVTIDDEPTVGMAAYLGTAAEPPPPVDFRMPDDGERHVVSDESVVSESAPAGAAATTVVAPPAKTGPGWVVIALVAAMIGGLLGAGIVGALDNDDGAGRTGNGNGFGRNTSVLAKPQDIQGVLAKVQPGVVSIKTQAFQRGIFGDAIPAAGAGTGMIITEDGMVLTNSHVVRGATSIEVTLFGESTSRFADLVGADPSADVAVIKIRDASGLPVVELGSSAKLQVGDAVLAIGNALALPGGPSVTAGIVSGKDRSIGAENDQLEGLIQTDAAINPGNSGGPLVNADGEVVGMNTAVIQSTGQALAQNVGFAIAIDTIKPMLERLKQGGGGIVGTRAFIGVKAQTMTPEIKEQYGFSTDKGAVIVEVTEGSPAENAGITPGDIVTKFGEEDIDSADELVAAVRSHKPGDKVEVTFVRGRDTRKVTLTVGSRPGGAGN